MVSSTEAPGGRCVLCLVTLEKHSPKCPSTLLKETTDNVPQQKSSWFSSWWLPFICHDWIKWTVLLIFASSPKCREGYYREGYYVHITHLFTQLLHCTRRWTEEKVEQNSSICLPESSPSLYNYILFILNQFPSSLLEISYQVNLNLVTWGILKHRNKTP